MIRRSDSIVVCKGINIMEPLSFGPSPHSKGA